MVLLTENNYKAFDRQSSKGNQLKWERDGFWYKADYSGYEGLAEFVISRLLHYSSLKEDEYVQYELTEIGYKNATYNGVKSRDFHVNGCQEVTVERLYKNLYGRSLYQSTWKIEGTIDRLKFFVEQVERLTGLKEFGIYLSKMLTIDALFLNEDRHMHNIAVLMYDDGSFGYCPIFDNGAGLLSDTSLDYPISMDIYDCIDEAESKTVCSSFEEQLEAVETLYGYNIKFSFLKKDVEKVLADAGIYSDEVKKRVYTVIVEQMRKYEYLFGE